MNTTSRAWLRYAACTDHDPELWFSDRDSDQAEAKRICRGCPVLLSCRANILALEGGASSSSRWGIVAGLTPNSRRSAYQELMAAAGTPARDIKPRGWHATVEPCGTPAAQQRHRRRGEACATCGTPRPARQPTPDNERKTRHRERAA